MQKKLLLVLVILSLVVTPHVNAACTYKEKAELNKEAANIKAVYEIITESATANDADMTEVVQYDRELFKINLLNLTENFYVVVTNNVDNDRNTYRFSDSLNGVVSYKWAKLEKVSTHTFNIYSSNKTGCANELFRTTYLTLPRYNSYYGWGICQEHKDLSLCDKYVMTEETSYSSFIERLNNATKTNTDKQSSDVTNNTDEEKPEVVNIYFISGCVVGLLVVILAFTLSRKKRNQL